MLTFLLHDVFLFYVTGEQRCKKILHLKKAHFFFPEVLLSLSFAAQLDHCSVLDSDLWEQPCQAVHAANDAFILMLKVNQL